jgi:hypothetical protein
MRFPTTASGTSLLNGATSYRNFSTAGPKDDIFESADYFKEASVDPATISGSSSSLDDLAETSSQVTSSLTSKPIESLPYFDLNDTACAFQSVIPKDVANLATGQPTYGIFEYINYLDNLLFDLWMVCSEPTGLGMGLGFGLIVSSMISKSVFAPIILYGQSVGIKMRLLAPDSDEMMANIKRLSS